MIDIRRSVQTLGACFLLVYRTGNIMNISKLEQRILHVPAQGGSIRYRRGSNGKLIETECITHSGYLLVNCTPRIVSNLCRKRLIDSVNSSPYRISEVGAEWSGRNPTTAHREGKT